MPIQRVVWYFKRQGWTRSRTRILKTKVIINQLSMDTEIGIITVGYIVYNVMLNWMYIKEYIGKGNGVIRRGMEWPE